MIHILRKEDINLNISELIDLALPDQGSIEIRKDLPGKEHVWHRNESDVTMIIVRGDLRIYWGDGDQVCYPGNVVIVESGTSHGSEALHKGAVYLKTSYRLVL